MSKKKVVKKTQTERLEAVVKKTIKEHPSYSISNCHVESHAFEGNSIEAVLQIAKGLTENADALGQLARVFSGRAINMPGIRVVSSMEPQDEQA